jgi:hypothetical protein
MSVLRQRTSVKWYSLAFEFSVVGIKVGPLGLTVADAASSKGTKHVAVRRGSQDMPRCVRQFQKPP